MLTDHQVVELGLVAHVDVQSTGAGLQRGRDPAHRQRRVPLGLDELERGGDERCSAT